MAFGTAVACGLSGSACGGFNAAGSLAQAPRFEPANQAKCSIRASAVRPLIIDWPSADRASLEARARTGLVVVRYSGCEMEVLSSCRSRSGGYAYRAVTPKRDHVSIRDADDLYANIPLGAAKLEAKLQKKGELSVSMTIVGTYQATAQEPKAADLEGDCASATHVVTALTAGSFEFFAGADAAVSGGATTLAGGASGSSSAQRETLSRDGDVNACAHAAETDERPPFGCGALLRLEVAPVAGIAPPKAPEVSREEPAAPSRAPLYVSATTGLLGVGLGSVAGLLALSDKSTVDANCNAQKQCSPAGLDAVDRGKTMTVVSTVGFGVGAAGLAAAAYFFFTERRSVTVGFAPTLGGGGIQLGGRY